MEVKPIAVAVLSYVSIPGTAAPLACSQDAMRTYPITCGRCMCTAGDALGEAGLAGRALDWQFSDLPLEPIAFGGDRREIVFE